MREHAAYTVNKMPDGTEQRSPYFPPIFPVRDHIITERGSGRALLLTPGQFKDGKPRPFVFLRDALHATRFTDDEAANHFCGFALHDNTHEITEV